MRSAIFLALLLLVPPALHAQQEDIPEAARLLLEQAQEAQNANRLDEAAAKYADVLARVPTAVQAYVGLGAIRYNKGEAAAAYEIFTRGLKVSPNNRTLLANAALAALAASRPQDALKHVDVALERNPDDADLHSLRSSALRATNRTNEAVTELQTAMRLAPNDPKFPFNLGNLYYAAGRKNEAIDAFKEAINRDKTYLRAWFNAGALFYEMGRYDEAISAYRIALAPIDKKFASGEPVETINARAYMNLGAIHFKQQQWKEALDAYSKAKQLDASDPAVFYNLGFIYFTTGDAKHAEESYKQALKLNEALPLAYLHLGTIAYRRGAYDQAVNYLTNGMPRFDAESRHDALRMLGAIHLARSDARSAEDAFTKLVAEVPEDVPALMTLSRLSRAGNRLDVARGYASRATKAAPADAAAFLELARVAHAQRDAAAEKAAYEGFFAAHGESWQARANYAYLLLHEGDASGAAKQFELASAAADAQAKPRLDAARAALAGTNAGTYEPVVRGNLGLSLWLDGKANDAKPHLAAALQALPQWNAVAIALGAIAMQEGNYALAVQRFTEKRAGDAPAGVVMFARGSDAELVARSQQWLATALVASAAQLLEKSPRSADARAQLDRALALPADARTHAVALYLRGTSRLADGNGSAARDDLAKAVAGNLPAPVLAAARNNLELARSAQ